jgi:ABC-type glycerol-3-phosphate transport system permease component
MSTKSEFKTWFDERSGEDMTMRRAAFVYAGLIAYFTFLLFPILYLVSSSFTTNDALFTSDLSILPGPNDFTVQHHLHVLTHDIWQLYFFNSFAVAIGTTLLTLGVGIPAAYSVSRFEYPGRDYVILALISSQMLPLVLVLIPFFAIMFTLGLIDTRFGLVLAHSVAAIPFVTWLLKGFFDAIPQALDDAAMMDGCNRIQVMHKIIVPQSLPGIAVAAFYAFVVSWSDYLFVSILSQSTGTRTLPLGLQLFQTADTVNWGAVTAAAVLTALPVVILFALVQNWLVEGLSNTGGKGV